MCDFVSSFAVICRRLRRRLRRRRRRRRRRVLNGLGQETWSLFGTVNSWNLMEKGDTEL